MKRIAYYISHKTKFFLFLKFLVCLTKAINSCEKFSKVLWVGWFVSLYCDIKHMVANYPKLYSPSLFQTNYIWIYLVKPTKMRIQINANPSLQNQGIFVSSQLNH